MGTFTSIADIDSIQQRRTRKLHAWHVAASVLIAACLVVAGALAFYGISESERLSNEALASRNASWTYEHVSSSLSPVVLEKLADADTSQSIVYNEEQALYNDVKKTWSERGVAYPVSGEPSPEQGSVEFVDMDSASPPPPISSPSSVSSESEDELTGEFSGFGDEDDAYSSSQITLYPINELITVKYLMVDNSDDTEHLRISDIWSKEELTQKVLGQQIVQAEIYGLSGFPDYYAVYATPTIENGIGLDIVDALAALDDAKGQAIDGVVYDKKHGIAYIPASAIKNGTAQRMQLQFLQRVDLLSNEQTMASINVHVSSSIPTLSDKVHSEQSITSDAFDKMIEISVFEREADALKENLSLDSFEVLFGGIPVELNDDTAIYNKNTGHLVLGYAPNGVADISVRIIPNKGIFESLADCIMGVEKADAARYVLNDGDISFFYNGGTFFDKITPTNLREGASYVYTSLMHPSPDNLEGSKYGVATGKWFDWGPANDAFANKIHYGASWDEVRTSSDYWFTIYGSGSAIMTAEGPFDKVFGGIDWHVQGDYTPLDLCCSHVTSAVGYDPHDYYEQFYGNCFIRILRVVNNGNWSYVIFGLQTPNATPYSLQAGSGLYKVRIATAAQLSIIKTSNGSLSQQVSSGSPIANARFGVYKDPACSVLLSTATTNAQGRATVEIRPDVTSYIKELSVPWPHVVSTEVKPVRRTYGEKITVNFSDDTSSVLYLNKSKRPQNGTYTTSQLDMGNGMSVQVSASISGENNAISYDVNISTDEQASASGISLVIPNEIALNADSISLDGETSYRYDKDSSSIELYDIPPSTTSEISFTAAIPKGWEQSASSAQLLVIKDASAKVQEALIAPLVKNSMAGAQYTVYIDKDCTIEAGDYNIVNRVSMGNERFVLNTSFSTRGTATIMSSLYSNKIPYYNWRPLGTKDGDSILVNTSSGLSMTWGTGNSGDILKNAVPNDSDKTQQWKITKQSSGTVEFHPSGVVADVPVVLSTWAGGTWPTGRETEARVIRENAYLDPNTAAYDEWYMTKTTGSSTMTVDANGNASWGNKSGQRLEPGYRYYVKETRSPEGYEADPKVYTFVAGVNEKHYLNVTDSYTSIEIHKQTHYPEYSDNDDRYSVEGAVYGVYDRDPSRSPANEPLYTLTTDADGHARVDYVKQGMTYYIKEISPSKGMMIDENVYELYAEAGTVNTIELFEDMPVEVNIMKESSELVPDVKAYSLEGAVFAVYGSESDAVNKDNAVATVVTDDLGQCPPMTLPMRDYWIREIEAPYGYYINENIQKVSVADFFANTTQSRVFKDVPKDIKIQLKKTADPLTASEEYFSSLANARFAVYNTYADAQNKVNAIREIVTRADGTCDAVTDLPPKEYYYVREVSAPEHYLINDEIFTMHVEDSIEFYQKIYDEGEPVSIDIEKVSSDPSVLESNYSLEGAVIGVYASEVDALNRENPVRIVETDKDGKCPRIEELYPRTYWVSEITPPDGFYLFPDPIQVHYTDSPLVSVRFEDDPHYGYLFVSKRSSDETATPQTSSAFSYEGAVFGIYDSKAKADAVSEGEAGDCLFTLTTDSNGNVRSTIPLVPGTYYLCEITAPRGYVASPATYMIETYEHEDLESGVNGAGAGVPDGHSEEDDEANNQVVLLEGDNEKIEAENRSGTLSSELFALNHAGNPIISSATLAESRATSVNAVKNYQATNSASSWWHDVPVILCFENSYMEFFGGNHGPVTNDIASIDKMQEATWSSSTSAQWKGLSTGNWNRNGISGYNEGLGAWDVMNNHGGYTVHKATDFYAEGGGARKLAEWRYYPAIDIYYNANTASGSAAKTTKWLGAAVNLNNASTLSKTGYHCIGWNHDSSSHTALYAPGQTIGAYDWNMTSQQRYCHFRESGVANAWWSTRGYINPKNARTFTLYAVWNPNSYNIAFNGNKATSGSVATTTGARYDQDLVLPKGGFSRLGHRLTGWNTKADGTGTHYDLGKTTRNLTSANNATVTLYAEWEEIPYTIAFDGNDATSGKMNPVRYLTELDYQLPANAYKKEGCEFVGWSLTRPYGNVRVIKARFADKATVRDSLLWKDSTTSIENKTITLYAVWKSTVDIEEDAFTVFDPPQKTTLQVVKKQLGELPPAADMKSTYSLAGARIGVYESESQAQAASGDSPGKPIFVIEVDENGIGYFDDAIVGKTYYLKELSPPTSGNYRIYDKVIKAGPVQENVPTTVSFTEPFDLPSDELPVLHISKSISGHDGTEFSNESGTWNVSGTQFGIYASYDEAVEDVGAITYVRANDEGEAFCELLPGTYWVRERIAAPGFVLDETPREVTVSADGQTELVIENEKAIVNIEIQKVNDNPSLTSGMEDDYSLAGAIFGVYKNKADAANKENPISELTTDENGHASLDGLYPNTYYIRELSAPSNFFASTKTYAVSPSVGDTAYVEVKNSPDVAQISIAKSSDKDVSSNDKLSLGGAVFAVYESREAAESKDEDEEIARLTTNASGMTGSINVHPGAYYIRELVAPMGHVVNDDVFEAEAGSGVSIVVNVEDHAPFGTISLTKESTHPDWLDNDLSGAVFSVFDDGQLSHQVTSIVTDKTGHAMSEELPAGAYYVKETLALPGHLPDSHVYEVSVADGEDVPINNGEAIVNETSSMRIYKSSNSTFYIDLPISGAVYGLYKTSSCSQDSRIAKLVTDDEGYSEEFRGIAPGTYYLREEIAPEGWKLDAAVYEIVLDSSSSPYELSVAEEPAYAEVDFTFNKINSETGTGERQGIVSTADAVFEISYYDESASTKAMLSGYEPERIWKVKTNASGYASLVPDELLDGSDELYTNTEGDVIIPVGTLVIEEVSAPDGMTIGTDGLDRELAPSKLYQIEDNIVFTDTRDSLSGSVDVFVADAPKRGNIKFKKTDDAGNALANIPFVISLLDDAGNTVESHLIATDENGVFDSSLVAGKADVNANDDLLYYHNDHGDEVIEEGVLPALAALLDDIAGTGAGDDEEEDYVPAEDVLAEEKTLDITADTHLEVPDMTVYEHGCGLWFSGSDHTEGNPSAEASGALIYGNYRLFEVECDGNDAYVFPEPIDFSISEDGVVVELPNIVNTKPVVAWTTAHDRTTTTKFGTTLDTHIDDLVNYENLVPGETYILSGVIYDADAKEVIQQEDWTPLGCSVELTPSEPSGQLIMSYDTAGFDLAGKTVSIYLRLENDYKTKSDHNVELTDSLETIRFPGIDTKAVDGATAAHYGCSTDGGIVKVIDTVRYENLEPGADYALISTLHESDVRIVEDANGNEKEELVDAGAIQVDGEVYEVMTEFTAESEDGQQEIVLEVPAEALDDIGRVTVFETLKNGDGIEVVHHNDIADENQTVYYPQISTEAADGALGGHIGSSVGTDGSASIADEVQWDAVKGSGTLTIKGWLVDANTLKAIEDAQGNMAYAEKKVDEGTSKATMSFENIPVSSIEGKDVVVFEEIYDEAGNLVAAHSVAESSEQTVSYPMMDTQALDSSTGLCIGYAGEAGGNVSITDTVTFSNVPRSPDDKVVELIGELRDADTGEVIADGSGQPITAYSTSTLKELANEKQMENVFDVPSALVSGRRVVVFEKAYVNHILIAEHADLTDVDQTVYYPSVDTEAGGYDANELDEDGNPADMGHDAPGNRQSVLYDIISYTALGGYEGDYIVKSWFVDSETGEVLSDRAGRSISTTMKLSTSDIEGKAKIVFPAFDLVSLIDKDIVAYEEIYVVDNTGEEHLVASHTDIADKEQTLHLRNATDPISMPESGMSGIMWGFFMGAGALVMLALGIWYVRRRPYGQM